MITITQEIFDRAKMHGACEVPTVGTDPYSLTQSQLTWADENDVITDADVDELTSPYNIDATLVVSSGSGSGDGYGYGYGSGYGSGDGSGSGSGDGYGSGSGSGYG